MKPNLSICLMRWRKSCAVTAAGKPPYRKRFRQNCDGMSRPAACYKETS